MTRQDAEAEFIARALFENNILTECKLSPEMFTTYRGVFSTIMKLF